MSPSDRGRSGSMHDKTLCLRSKPPQRCPSLRIILSFLFLPFSCLTSLPINSSILYSCSESPCNCQIGCCWIHELPDLLNPGIKTRSPALQTAALPSEPLGKLGYTNWPRKLSPHIPWSNFPSRWAQYQSPPSTRPTYGRGLLVPFSKCPMLKKEQSTKNQ